MQTQTYSTKHSIPNQHHELHNNQHQEHHSTQHHEHHQNVHLTVITKKQLQVVSPQDMLKALVYSVDINQLQEQRERVNMSANATHLQGEVNEQIKYLRLEINNLRSEVVQVQNLLNVRDNLYQELDHLRQQRQQIQGEIEQTIHIDHTEVKITSGGYKQMNERLRRRVYEIRQYIQKMSEENLKIEEGIVSHQYINQEEEIYNLRKQVDKPTNQRTLYDNKRYGKTNFEQMMSNLHEKQEEAWRRVRRQQQDIDRRNQERRGGSKNNNFTYYSPKARTYYSPGREIY